MHPCGSPDPSCFPTHRPHPATSTAYLRLRRPLHGGCQAPPVRDGAFGEHHSCSGHPSPTHCIPTNLAHEGLGLVAVHETGKDHPVGAAQLGFEGTVRFETGPLPHFDDDPVLDNQGSAMVPRFPFASTVPPASRVRDMYLPVQSESTPTARVHAMVCLQSNLPRPARPRRRSTTFRMERMYRHPRRGIAVDFPGRR